jgi:hypothetical protein
MAHPNSDFSLGFVAELLEALLCVLALFCACSIRVVCGLLGLLLQAVFGD